jgi:subtilisin family serine protease
MIVAIYVAHLSGADVINGSWTLPYIVEPFYDTLTHFIHSGRNKKGGVALFASGNGRHKPINSVCGIDGVLCVGAANNNGNITPYTRRAKTLDLLAPSPLPSLHVKQPYYRRSGGTSSSTAFVSGVAALLISVNPKIRGDMVHSILVESTKRLAGYPLIQPYKVIRKGLDLE